MNHPTYSTAFPDIVSIRNGGCLHGASFQNLSTFCHPEPIQDPTAIIIGPRRVVLRNVLFFFFFHDPAKSEQADGGYLRSILSNYNRSTVLP